MLQRVTTLKSEKRSFYLKYFKHLMRHYHLSFLPHNFSLQRLVLLDISINLNIETILDLDKFKLFVSFLMGIDVNVEI